MHFDKNKDATGPELPEEFVQALKAYSNNAEVSVSKEVDERILSRAKTALRSSRKPRIVNFLHNYGAVAACLVGLLGIGTTLLLHCPEEQTKGFASIPAKESDSAQSTSVPQLPIGDIAMYGSGNEDRIGATTLPTVSEIPVLSVCKKTNFKQSTNTLIPASELSEPKGDIASM